MNLLGILRTPLMIIGYSGHSDILLNDVLPDRRDYGR